MKVLQVQMDTEGFQSDRNTWLQKRFFPGRGRITQTVSSLGPMVQATSLPTKSTALSL